MSNNLKHACGGGHEGLLIPTPIDGEVRLWCSFCGATLRSDCSCGATFSNEKEAHCSACHAHFATDDEFLAHECGRVVFGDDKSAGQDAKKMARRTEGALALQIRQIEDSGATQRCKKGLHPWTPDNIYISPKKVASCRKCRRDAARARRG